MPPDDKMGESKGQDPKDSQPQAGTSPSGQEPGAESKDEAASKGGTSESRLVQLESENAELRREAAKNRKALQDAQRAEAEKAKAGESEQEKLQRQIAELEQRLTDMTTTDQERTVRLAAVEIATRLGFRSPDVAYRLLDRAAIDFAEDGTPRNVERLLKDVADRDPYLLKPSSGQPDFGGGNRGKTPTGAPGMNELLRKAIGH
jgi:hypothetical protein